MNRIFTKFQVTSHKIFMNYKQNQNNFIVKTLADRTLIKWSMCTSWDLEKLMCHLMGSSEPTDEPEMLHHNRIVRKHKPKLWHILQNRELVNIQWQGHKSQRKGEKLSREKETGEPIGNGILCCCFFKRFYLFIFREGKGGRKRERETSMCGCLLHVLYWGPGPQPTPEP